MTEAPGRVRIHKALYGGACETEPQASLSIPFTLPGELVEVATSGSLVSILDPSAHRVTPQCPHFGACGGCQYQHADYSAQTSLKVDILGDTLEAAGLRDLPVPQVHTAEPWGYRNRIRLRVDLLDGEPRVGYNRRATVHFLPIRECPIAAPILVRAAEALRALAITPPFAAWSRQLTEVELFTAPGEARLQLTLFVRSGRGLDLPALCAGLKLTVPELAGAGMVLVGASGKQAQPGASWGADGLSYRVAGRDYWVPRGSFFQVNRFLVDRLVDLATAHQAGELAWDLYAGVGLFSRALRDSFTTVTGVEVNAPKNSGTIASTTLDFLRKAVLQRDHPSLIVMDPPRAGLGEEVCALLARVKAPEMVYVSCDPVTLARDLKAMVDSGYTIRNVHLVDLFPQTFHLETVVMLHR